MSKVYFISTFIKYLEYNAQESQLTIGFTDGEEFTYKDVPIQVYQQFLEAPSAGKFFHEYIKDNYEYE